MKRKLSKVLAALQVLAMLIGLIPIGMVTTVFAAPIANYTVNLTDGTSVLDLDDVDVTLTDSTDEEKTSTVQTVDGVATFTDFVEEGATYTLSIIGYDADVTEITVAEEDTSKDVIVTEIEKVAVSGVVKVEESNPYEGATVEVSGYGSATTTTDANGAYSVDVYKGKEVTITVTPKSEDEKYEVLTKTVTYDADNFSEDFEFSPKIFVITTSVGANGTITSSENVEFGTNKDIEITANTGYRIEKVTVTPNGDVNAKYDISEAGNEQSYTLSLTDIQQDYDIVVTFYRMT